MRLPILLLFLLAAPLYAQTTIPACPAKPVTLAVNRNTVTIPSGMCAAATVPAAKPGATGPQGQTGATGPVGPQGPVGPAATLPTSLAYSFTLTATQLQQICMVVTNNASLCPLPSATANLTVPITLTAGGTQ